MSSDDAGDLRSVTEVVGDVVVVGDEVPAAEVVGEAVVVVVGAARSGLLEEVDREVALEIGVSRVNAGVNHGDKGRRRGSGGSACGAAGLELGWRGQAEVSAVDDVVRFDPFDRGVEPAQVVERLVEIAVWLERELDDVARAAQAGVMLADGFVGEGST